MPTTADWIQVGVVSGQTLAIVILVVVTFWYARSTKRIQEATREQAQASQQLAQQAEKQLHHSFRPIVKFTTHPSDPMYLGVQNIGPGPALNLRCYVEVLLPGNQKKVSLCWSPTFTIRC